MLNKVSISRSATNKLDVEYKKTGLRPNIIARNAFMASLETDNFFDSNQLIDMSGKEFNTYTLFGDNIDLYMVFIKHKYHSYSGYEFFLPQIIAWHIEGGF